MPLNSAKTIRQRLGISFEERIATAAMITALGVLLAACLVFSLTQWQAEARLSREARTTVAQLIAKEIAVPLSEGNLAALRQTLKGVASVEGVKKVVIIDPQGRPLFTAAASLQTKRAEATTDIAVPIQAPNHGAAWAH